MKPLLISVLLILAASNSFSQGVAFTMYTVQKNTLKLTAQLHPQSGNYPNSANLEVDQAGNWQNISTANINNPGWTVTFKVNNWDMTKDVSFRVTYNGTNWTGVIRKDPIDKDTIIVAAFTGNSRGNGGGDISKQDIVDNMKTHAPDLLFFSGDQVYPHNNHLTYWLEFGAAFGEIMRDIPMVSLPDDHDAGQGNLFGEGGIAASGINGYNNGGYVKSADYVKEVEKAQTSHLPDPYDPTPVARGIGVYYTSLNVGGIGFAIIEDRKFKTGPQGLVPEEFWNRNLNSSASGRPDHINMNTTGYTPDKIDVPGAILLGDRQLQFLNTWAQDWTGVEMKSVLSATVFGGLATHHGGGRKLADLDSNGWPQTGRNKALDAIRKTFGFMISGDQHLATIAHHGIDNWNDAGWSFVVPSIANFYARKWEPEQAGSNRQPGYPTYTGEFLDGFGNRVNVWAAANPTVTGRTPSALHDKAPGYGIIKFDKKERKITMECWPRQVNPRSQGSSQYTGWPLTISQENNYGRTAVEYLPTLDIRGMQDPVVQIINKKNNQVEYTIRIKGTTYRPKVFESGDYDIRVGEFNSNEKTVTARSLPTNQNQTLIINLSGTPISKPKVLASKKEVTVNWKNQLKQISLNIPNSKNYFIDIVDPQGKISVSRKLKGPGVFKISIPRVTPGIYYVNVGTIGQNNWHKIQIY